MKQRTNEGFTFLELLVIVGIVAILAAILVPNFMRARARGQLTACKSNLKNIGTALEMYSTDHEGFYPPSLATLTPNYLRVIPTCPKAGEDTYSSTFNVDNAAFLAVFKCPTHSSYRAPQACQERRRQLVTQVTGLEDPPSKVEDLPQPADARSCPEGGVAYNYELFKGYYRFQCGGHHHAGTSLPADYPAYDAFSGLLERP